MRETVKFTFRTHFQEKQQDANQYGTWYNGLSVQAGGVTQAAGWKPNSVIPENKP
jgi:hypothetical protein